MTKVIVNIKLLVCKKQVLLVRFETTLTAPKRSASLQLYLPNSRRISVD